MPAIVVAAVRDRMPLLLSGSVATAVPAAIVTWVVAAGPPAGVPAGQIARLSHSPLAVLCNHDSALLATATMAAVIGFR